MDSSSTNIESLSKLSDKDKSELQQFITNETQKARIQQIVHDMTDTCWKKCFANASMKGGKLTSNEEACTRNCVGRFLDGNQTIVQELERFRTEGLGN